VVLEKRDAGRAAKKASQRLLVRTAEVMSQIATTEAATINIGLRLRATYSLGMSSTSRMTSAHIAAMKMTPKRVAKLNRQRAIPPILTAGRRAARVGCPTAAKL
jgi:hypothetical protein